MYYITCLDEFAIFTTHPGPHIPEGGLIITVGNSTYWHWN